MKTTLKHLLLPCLLLSLLPARALQIAAPPPRAYGYIMWQDKYLLVGARIEDSMLVGTATEPQVFPANDDGVEVNLTVSRPGGGITSHRLAFSVAGGFAALTQAEGERWKTDNCWLQPPATIKFAMVLDGTLNKSNDLDRGYTFEAAIPWECLGGTPRPLTVLGFNFALRTRGESQSFSSWAAEVTEEADNENPEHWGRLILLPAASPVKAEDDVFPCPRTYQMPLIDGKLGAEEWIGASLLTLQKPTPEIRPTPERESKPNEPPQLLAIYNYDFPQPVPDAPPPFARFIVAQPREGLGPWYTSARAGWHREQLQEIQRAGIEILLASYAPNRQEGDADFRLRALVSALKELRAARRPYPLLGLYLDSEALASALGDNPDLTTPQGRQVFYRGIRDFYRQIPPEFRAEIGDSEKTRGLPVLLGPPRGLSNWNAAALESATQNFAQDFSGARLVWLADPAWKSKGVSNLAAYPPLSGVQPSGFDASGRFPVAVISPGRLDSPTNWKRLEPQDFRQQWSKLQVLAPAYVVLDSWNDFFRGRQIAPSRQEGFTFVDALQLLVSQTSQEAARPVRLKKANLPAALAPGATTQVELVLGNISPEMIRSDERIGLDVRLLDKNGKTTLGRDNDVLPLRLPPGGMAQLLVPVRARGGDGRSLPRGEYLVEFALRRSTVAYFKSSLLSKDIAVFRLPLRVVKPADYVFSLLDSGLPGNLKKGGKYPVSVILRNDGARAWQSKDTRLFYQWYRVSEAGGTLVREALQLKTPAANLPKAVKPGEVVVLAAAVVAPKLSDPAPAGFRHYELAWELESGGKLAQSEAPGEIIFLSDYDLGGYFVDAATSGAMPAGKSSAAEIILTNEGPDPLLPANTAVVGHWYYWDGSLAQWQASVTPLPEALAPGASLKIPVTITAPAFAGPYHLVWDLRQGDNFASRRPTSRSNETLRREVMVTDGPAQALDLSGYGNVIAAASDRRRASGDFDGLGNCLPIEALPPDLSGNPSGLYPSGYYLPEAAGKAICFRYPEKNSGLMKAIACRGQEISLPENTATRLHILGAGTGAGLSGGLLATFSDGSSENLPLTLSSWLEPPSHGERLAFQTAFLRGAGGDNFSQAAYLHHYVLTLSRSETIASLTLPNNPEMKIFAITLESAAGP